VESDSDPPIVRKATLLLGEVLKLASRLLPSNYSARMQLLPNLFHSASKFGLDGRFSASAAVYQIDSLNRTLHRSLPSSRPQLSGLDEEQRGQRQVELKMKLNMTIDDRHFSNLIVDTGVCRAATCSGFWLTTIGLKHQKPYKMELGCLE